MNRSLQTVTSPDDWRATQTISGTRTDQTLAFSTGTWGARGPVGITGGSDANWDNFSVQWDGWLQVTQAGQRISSASDDGSQMWIDLNGDGQFGVDELLINGWGRGQGVTTGERSRPLAAGAYRIRIQYYELSAGNEFHLLTANVVPAQFVPAAGNPRQIVRAVVLNFEPRIPSESNKRLWEVFGWNDPRRLASQFEADLEFMTGGAVDIQIVEMRHLDEFPLFTDGFRYEPAQYVQNRRTNTNWHSGNTDFYYLAKQQNLAALVNSNQIDEIWCFGDHFFNLFGEAWMVGPNSFFINGPSFPNIGFDRAIAGYGFNYERGVAEMVHNLCHRTENHGQRAFGNWNLANPVTAFDRFSANFRDSPGRTAGVGTCHFPVNADADYDYGDTRVVTSTALDWQNYPATTGATTAVSRDTWGMGPAPDYQRDYLNFYFGMMPRNSTNADDGRRGNWFKYIWDFNGYESGTGRPREEDAFGAGATIETAGATSHAFTVRYYDSTGVNVATLDGNDVKVRAPGGALLAATLESVGPEVATTAGTARTVTYRVNAPGGAWDAADGGGYTIALAASQVRDTLGNYFPAGDVGGFQVVLPDSSAINVAQMLASGAASVVNTTLDIGPIGNLFDGSVSSLIRTPNIDPAVVTLTFTQPQTFRGFSAYFSNASGSPAYQWRVETADSQEDLDGQTGTWRMAVALTGTASDRFSTVILPAPVTARIARLWATRLTGDNYVHITEWQLLGPQFADSDPPTVSAASPNVSAAGITAQFFTMNVADAVGIDVSSLHTGDLVVTGPGGFSANAVFYGVDNYLDGSPRVATYWLIPPGGSWTPANGGVYTFALPAAEVFDINGNAAPAQTLGTFTVNVAAPERRPPYDLTENNAASWLSGADGATATTANDSTRKQLGASSVRFETTGGADTWLRFPPPNTADWDLTNANNLYFSVYAENTNSPYFQNNSPWIRLRDPNGGYFDFRYYQSGNPSDPLNSALNQWRAFIVPLRAAATVTDGWRRTISGAPRLDHIASIEFHADTWGFGFRLWYDRVGFDLPVRVLESSFASAPAPARLRLRFDQSVAATLATSDLVLVKDGASSIPPGAMALAYDTATDTANVTFPGLPSGILSDGYYRLTIASSAIADPAGNTLGTPFVFDFVVVDGDGDGMPDAWERAYGFDPLDAGDALKDSDGDGQITSLEYRAGTNPRDAASRFAITQTARTATALELTWPSAEGRQYRVRWTDDLRGDWTTEPALIDASAGTSTTTSLPLGNPAPAQRFFAIELVSP